MEGLKGGARRIVARRASVALAAVTASLLCVTIPASAAQLAIPATTENFLGLGATQGGCVFPAPQQGEPAGCVTYGDPPETVGAVGPNNYVELDSGGIGIFDKSGNLLQTPVFLNTIWAGYPTTDGNNCAAGPHDNPAGNWGDPIVRYDQLANRWLVSQFDITNYANNNTGPSFECVAVSQTSDPTGGWNLYDFEYSAALIDYPKFGIWPDGYYVTYNEFSSTGFLDSRICALDRTAMLAGQAASQICKTSSTFSLLPANVDGPIPLPSGTPEYVAALGSNKIELFEFHVDWATPGDSTFTGPTNLATTSFSEACGGGNCIPQPSPGNELASLGDRLMDRLVYRNFGTHESLLLTHSVTAGGVASGVRWYEVRDPGGTPTIYQQGTYAPDGSSRWMGSIAMDQAGDIALGYSLSSSTIKPSIAYTGRLAGDPLGQMPQGEGVIATGGGVETGSLPNGQQAQRWGDYSSMTVDPSDDCTFWYANELYPSNGIFNWDTRIASFKFPNCAANDFSIAPSSTSVAVPPGGSNGTTVSTTLTQGTAETVQLNAFDLPAGVTASFSPASVTAGDSSTLTFNADADATLGTYTVHLVGTATSALHGTTVTVTVAPTHALTVTNSVASEGTVTSDPAGIDCGATCAATFVSGTPVTLSATPAEGSVFLNWSGDCSGTDPSCGVTMDADRAATADFDGVPSCADGNGTTSLDTPVQLALSCSDPDSGDNLTYSVVSAPVDGTLGPVDSSGNVTYTPFPGYSGPDSFTFKATDSHGVDSATATVNLTVEPIPAPTCTNDSASTDHNVAVGLTLVCSAPGSFTYAIVSPPSHGALGTVGADGSVTYTPAFGFGGQDTFTFKATDSHDQDSNVATATVTVASDSPPACSGQTVSVAHGKAKQIVLGCSDSDSGDTLQWSIVAAPGHGKLSAIDGSGDVTYTPATRFGGTDGFTFKATDNEGADSNVATINLKVAKAVPCFALTGHKLKVCKAKLKLKAALEKCDRIKQKKQRTACIAAAERVYRRSL